jgi:hypothetical protein
MDKFYAFYRVYGAMSSEVFDSEDAVIEFYAEVQGKDESNRRTLYGDLQIIYGHKVKFEPVEIVKKWKIKDTSDE